MSLIDLRKEFQIRRSKKGLTPVRPAIAGDNPSKDSFPMLAE
jgi:hypothetical protein